MQKKLEDEKRITIEKIAESQKALKEFNVNKMMVVISGIMQRKQRHFKTKVFDHILLYSKKISLIMAK